MSDYEKLFWEASNLAKCGSDFGLFKSQFIRSLQDSRFSKSEMDEFMKILDSPTGELIFHMGYFASKQS